MTQAVFNPGYTFRNPDLLQQALHHPSLPFTPPSPYERLEFLGDRVLGLVIAQLLYERFLGDHEGQLARHFVSLVRKETLAEVAKKIGLDQTLMISKGEITAGGRENPSILADSCEALIAAIYMDGGLEAAREFILLHWMPLVENIDQLDQQDPKSALQEMALKLVHKLPEYKIVKVTGPDHAPEFTMEVVLPGFSPYQGHGKSRRDAEQQAARQLLRELVQDKDDK